MNWTNEDFRLYTRGPRHQRRGGHSRFHRWLYWQRTQPQGAYEYGGLAWNAGVSSRPTLAITSPGNGNLVLTASPDAAYYQLYVATNLTSPLWTLCDEHAVVLANQWSVTLAAATNALCFYRLQAQ